MGCGFSADGTAGDEHSPRARAAYAEPPSGAASNATRAPAVIVIDECCEAMGLRTDADADAVSYCNRSESSGAYTAEPTELKTKMRLMRHVIAARVLHGIDGAVPPTPCERAYLRCEEVREANARCDAWLDDIAYAAMQRDSGSEAEPTEHSSRTATDSEMHWLAAGSSSHACSALDLTMSASMFDPSVSANPASPATISPAHGAYGSTSQRLASGTSAGPIFLGDSMLSTTDDTQSVGDTSLSAELLASHQRLLRAAQRAEQLRKRRRANGVSDDGTSTPGTPSITPGSTPRYETGFAFSPRSMMAMAGRQTPRTPVAASRRVSGVRFGPPAMTQQAPCVFVPR